MQVSPEVRIAFGLLPPRQERPRSLFHERDHCSSRPLLFDS